MGVTPRRGTWLTATTMGAGTGLIGVLSGFALFILMWQEPERGVREWAAVVALAAAFSLLFEFLKAQIEGHDLGAFSIPRVMATILLLSAFEVFADALHSAAAMSIDDFAILGIAIVGPGFGLEVIPAAANLLIMIGVWIGAGLIVGGALGSVFEGLNDSPIRLNLRSLLVGLFAAPVCILLYVVAHRLRLGVNDTVGMSEIPAFVRSVALVWMIPSAVLVLFVPFAVRAFKRWHLRLEAYWPVVAIAAALLIVVASGCAAPGFVEIQRQSVAVSGGRKIAEERAIGLSLANAELPQNARYATEILVPAATTKAPDVLAQTAERLKEIEDRLSALSTLATKMTAINEKGLDDLLLSLRLGPADRFLLGDRELKDMGTLTAAVALLSDPAHDRYVTNLDRWVDVAMKNAVSATKQAEANIAAAPTNDDGARAVRQMIAIVALRRAELDAVKQKFDTREAHERAVKISASSHLDEWRQLLAARMLITMNAALGFWLAVGLLASRVLHGGA